MSKAPLARGAIPATVSPLDGEVSGRPLWLPPAAIAGRAGCPARPTDVARWAMCYGVRRRRRQGRGGGYEYCAADLPAATRDAGRIDDLADGTAGAGEAEPPRRRPGRVCAIDGDPALHDLAIAMVAEFPHVDAVDIQRAFRARLKGRSLPNLRTTQRWLAALRRDRPDALLLIAAPDRYRSRYQPAFGSQSEGADGRNAVWETDCTPVDLFTADGRRHTIVGVIDVWSRQLSLLLVPNPSAANVLAAVRRCLLAWGVPAVLKTDQGSDFKAERTLAALRSLEIEHLMCPAFTPEGKPHIERVLQTVAYSFLELLPGYAGHNVAGASDIRERRAFAARIGKAAGERPAVSVRLTTAELQDRLDAYARDVYGRETHGTTGEAPELRANGWTGPVRRIADERALDALLAPWPSGGCWRVIGKSGLRLDGGTYIAPELVAHGIGRTVEVRCDPADAGRVWVFADDRFLCIAVDPAREGVDRAAIAAAAKVVHAERKKAIRAEFEAARKRQNVAGIADEILAAARARAEQVVPLGPRNIETYSTPALQEAARAVAAAETPVGPALPPALQVVQDTTPVLPRSAPRAEDAVDQSRRRYRLWEDLKAQEIAGTLPAEMIAKLRQYEGSPEFRAVADMADYERAWDARVSARG